MSNKQSEKNLLTAYEQQILASLYQSLDYAKCEDLPFAEILAAIQHLESLNKKRNQEAKASQSVKLTETQQRFMQWVELADSFGENAYFEFGMYKPFYRRTCDSLVQKGLVEYVSNTRETAVVKLVKSMAA